MAIIGYVRVSTNFQKYDSQLQALEKYGVDKIYKERESGRKQSRSELNKVLKILQPGDTFVIFKLDRLARGTQQLLQLLEEFQRREINFVSIENYIDTSTPMGKFFFTIMSAFAEMEAELIRERVLAGIEAAKQKGIKLGRPPLVKQVGQAIELYVNSDMTVAEIAKKCNISEQTIYHHVRKKGMKKKAKS